MRKIIRPTKAVDPKKVANEPIKQFSDCSLCLHHKESKFGLIQCQRPKANIIPHPNCKEWRVECVFFETNKKKKL